MTGLYTWVKNMAYFFILVTIVMNLVPGKQYKKYIKLFTGIILILIILSPVSQLFNLEESLSFYLNMENYQLELEQVQYDLLLADEKHYEMVTLSYEEDIKNQIEIWAKEKGLYLLDSSIYWEMDSTSSDYGKIKGMDLIMSKKEHSVQEEVIDIGIEKVMVSLNSEEESKSKGSIEEIYLKTLIQDFYNIPVNNINVSIQE
ncbi:MAG: stage III sporulation protein AF [Clostridiales bacterium]|nr:stage III sporulation protein AF [Clostridiales bacterium]